MTTIAAWRQSLHEITVAADTSSAEIGGHQLTASNARQLQGQLSVAIYDHLHAGRGPESAGRPRRIRDSVFEGQLGAGVPHHHSEVTAVIRRLPQLAGGPVGTATALLVEHAGLRLWVQPSAVQTPADQWATGAPVAVRVSARRPALSPGFFLVDGVRSIPHDGGELLRVYLHLATAADATRAWSTVLQRLEARQVVYRAKVLSAAGLFPRRDSLVVYLPPESWGHLQAVCELMAAVPGRLAETSQFGRRFAPGVAMAFEPRDRTVARRGLSFGQHRAIVAASALIDSVTQATNLDDELDRQFVAANIDPADPSRNLSSRSHPDFPVLFD